METDRRKIRPKCLQLATNHPRRLRIVRSTPSQTPTDRPHDRLRRASFVRKSISRTHLSLRAERSTEKPKLWQRTDERLSGHKRQGRREAPCWEPCQSISSSELLRCLAKLRYE